MVGIAPTCSEVPVLAAPLNTSLDPKKVVPRRSTNRGALFPGLLHVKVAADPESVLPGAGVVKKGVEVGAGVYFQRSFKVPEPSFAPKPWPPKSQKLPLESIQ